MDLVRQNQLRELDIAIAQKVMGWTRRDKDIGEDYPGTFFSAYDDGGQIVVFWGGSQGNAERWSPAQNIIAALRVMKHLREFGCWTWIRTFTHTTRINVEMGIPSSECQEWGETIPEAICRCALKAKEKFNLP